MVTSSTPVASGSSVPAWPILLGATSGLIRLITSRLVIPAGLWALSRPNIQDLEVVEACNLGGSLGGEVREAAIEGLHVPHAECSELVELVHQQLLEPAAVVASMPLGVHHQAAVVGQV